MSLPILFFPVSHYVKALNYPITIFTYASLTLVSSEHTSSNLHNSYTADLVQFADIKVNQGRKQTLLQNLLSRSFPSRLVFVTEELLKGVEAAATPSG